MLALLESVCVRKETTTNIQSKMQPFSVVYCCHCTYVLQRESQTKYM